MMTFMTEPDHLPYIPLEQEARNEDVQYLGYEQLPAQPAPTYARSTLITLNLILLVLIPILVFLGASALKNEKTDYERQKHDEYCAIFKYGDPDLPDDCPRPVKSVEQILNGD